MAGTDAITSNSPVAGIAQPASAVPSILDLLKYIGGSKTTTAGSEAGNASTTGNTSGVNTQQGQTGPLEAIISQLSDSNNLANLVANLFSQGAAQVPGLTTQFANATGTRVDNNTMLGQSLAMLNQNIAQAIAQSVVQQQGTAATAAGKLADVNKTNTNNQATAQQTSTNKTATQTATTQPASIAKVAGSAGGVLLAGSLLNKLGSKAPVSTAPIDISNANFPGLNIPALEGSFGPSVTDASAPILVGGGTTDDAAGGFVDDGAAGAAGAGDVADAGAAVADAGADVVANADLSDVSDSFDASDIFGFKHGGSVPPMQPKVKINRTQPKGYADGGTVEGDPNQPIARNIPFRGSPLNAGAQQAVHFVLTPVPAGGAVDPVAGKRRGISGVEDGASDSSVQGSATAASVAPGGAGTDATANSVGEGTNAPAVGIGGIAVAIANALTGNVPAAIASLGKSVAVNQIVSALTSGNSAGGATGAQGGVSTGLTGEDTDSAEGVSAIGEGGVAGDGNAGAASSSAAASTGLSGDSVADAGAAAGDGAGGAGDAGSGDGSGDAGGGSGDAGGGDGAGSAGGGDGGFAAGGRIKPRIKADTEGVDKELIRATPGEYVLPLDVVEYLGRDNLDELISLVHTR